MSSMTEDVREKGDGVVGEYSAWLVVRSRCILRGDLAWARVVRAAM